MQTNAFSRQRDLGMARMLLETKMVRVLTVIAVAVLLSLLLQPVAAADDGDLITEAKEIELSQRFKPVLYFEAQERTFPVNVEYFLQSCNLNQSVSGTSVLIDPAPTVVSLGAYGDPAANYFLDNRLGTIHDEKIIEQYQRDKGSLGYTVYSHVTGDSTRVVVQYWFFYVFNQGKFNNHEGDWEMVEIVLDSAEKPVYAAYSQHNYGQKASWDMVEKDGDHLNVYVARGSHANYLRYYQGTLEFARDSVGNNGKVLRPDNSEYQLVLLGEKGAGNHPAAQNFIDYGGYWGAFGNTADGLMGRRGPPGPGFRENGDMWVGFNWGNARQQLSQDFLNVEWPIYYWVPIYAVIIAIPIIYHSYRIMRKVQRKQLKKPYIRLFDFKGMNLKTIGNIMAIAGLVIGLVSAFFPYYYAQLNANVGDFQTGGWIDLFIIDGQTGLQVNALDPSGGLVQVGSVPIPFGYLVIAGLLVFVFVTVGATRRRAGRKYLLRGVDLVVPLILTVLVVAGLASILGSIPSVYPGLDAPQVKEMVSVLSAHPFGGDMNVNFPGYGTAQMKWGIGIGAYIMMLAGALLLLGGIFQIISKEAPEWPQPVQPTNQQPAPAYQQQYQQPPQQYAPPQDQQYQPPQNRQP